MTGSAVPAQVAQAANVSGNDDVVSPSQAEISDLTATGSRADPVQAPTQDQAAPAAEPAAQAPATSTTPQTTASPATQPVTAPAAQPQPVVATAANPSAELKIYDTTSQPISQLLAQAQQDGATVVGPLLKENVEEVIKSNTPLNVLALNQPEKSKAALTSAISRFLRKTKRVTPPDISTNRGNRPRCCWFRAARWAIVWLALLPTSG